METTWDLARTGVEWTTGGADSTANDRDADPSGSQLVSETNVWYGISIAALVQQWVNGTRPNDGMVLIASGNTVEMSFWSSEYSIKDLRPKLEISYVYGSVPTPTSTPDVTATTGPSPTPTLTQTPGGSETVFQTDGASYDGVIDTYISSWQPTDNYGGNVTMLVRQGDVRAALVRFDLSSIPTGSTIEEARLGLYSVSRSNAGNLTVDAYAVRRPWAELQATWNQATTSTAWGSPGCNQTGTDRDATPISSQVVNTIDTWYEWDVTALVGEWVANPASNQGVILKGSGATSVEYYFAASEYWWALDESPRLTVRIS
jgi:hypothetical protein